MENDNHEKYGDTRNTGRRGLQGEAKTKSLLWPHSIGIRGATLLEYKKGLKRPTLAWNEIPFVTQSHSATYSIQSFKQQARTGKSEGTLDL